MTTLADRLRAARIAEGLTQHELAKRAGVTLGTIGNAEAGIRKQPRALLVIAAALGRRPQFLLTGRGPEFVDDTAPAPRLQSAALRLAAMYQSLDVVSQRRLDQLADALLSVNGPAVLAEPSAHYSAAEPIQSQAPARKKPASNGR